MAEPKTNAQRILEREKIAYKAHSYDASDGHIDGVAVAQKVGLPAERVYKTLVTRGASKALYVFVIPVAEELDLKAAAKSVKEKSVSMIAVKELLPLTGYIRGGCSPVGMKKRLPTVIDSTANEHMAIAVSAGRIGTQAELSPDDLVKVTGAIFADVIQHNQTQEEDIQKW